MYKSKIRHKQNSIQLHKISFDVYLCEARKLSEYFNKNNSANSSSLLTKAFSVLGKVSPKTFTVRNSTFIYNTLISKFITEAKIQQQKKIKYTTERTRPSVQTRGDILETRRNF